ncbi:putative gustatory receptor 22a [Musca vetustissima]|uniref:putative gustatory receptor 22a n=1 Tax=Musca vetustissima TaxID=27455 RepID=UPI002AB7A69A|nr:putative gustatory receptor 22a [Musca vetustissima]
MFQRWWFQTIVIFCIITSSINFRVDLRKRRIVRLRLWIQVFMYITIISLALFIPFCIKDIFEKSQLYLTNPVAIYANNTTALIRILMFLVVAVTLQQRYKRLESWLEAIMEIQMNYFDRQTKPLAELRDVSHRKWLYLSSLIAVTHYAIESTNLGLHNSEMENNIDFTLYPFFFMLSIQHTFMLIHAGLLCYLRECFSILHGQLSQRWVDPQLPAIYNRLRCLYGQLNQIYGPSMLCVILCVLLSNSMVGYITLVIILLPDLDRMIYKHIFGSIFYGFLLIHWYIYFMLCDEVETTIRDIEIILIGYATNKCESIERELELLILSRCLHSPSVNFCGILDINWNSLFCIFAQTVSYIITLVQLDYVNLI